MQRWVVKRIERVLRLHAGNSVLETKIQRESKSGLQPKPLVGQSEETGRRAGKQWGQLMGGPKGMGCR